MNKPLVSTTIKIKCHIEPELDAGAFATEDDLVRFVYVNQCALLPEDAQPFRVDGAIVIAREGTYPQADRIVGSWE